VLASSCSVLARERAKTKQGIETEGSRAHAYCLYLGLEILEVLVSFNQAIMLWLLLLLLLLARHST